MKTDFHMKGLTPRLAFKKRPMVNSKMAYCVNNKMLEYDWSLAALIYGLIGCFRSKLSDLTCPTTNICNRTAKEQIRLFPLYRQPININHLAHPIQSKLRNISYMRRLTGTD